MGLQSSVLKLSHEYKQEHYCFWGRVEGSLANYYIVEGVNFRGSVHFPQKTFFWRYLPIHSAAKTSSLQSCLSPGKNLNRRSSRTRTYSRGSTKRLSPGAMLELGGASVSMGRSWWSGPRTLPNWIG